MRKTMIPVALVCAALLGAPSLAHEGLVHEGCDPAATFETGGLTVSGAFTRATLPNAQTAGGYLTIANGGTAPDRLLGAASEAAALVQIHQMKMEGDMMKMSEVEGGLEIPAGSSVTLAPGGYHVMFLGVGKPFAEGECVALTLTFEKAGELPVLLPIGDAAADAAPTMQMHGTMEPAMKH